jgi:Lon protease-like protein
VTRRLPIFPLGSVLLPTAVLPLHVFEPRYLALMDDLTGAELGTPLITPELGVVGIERGHEVGGGELRARTGTVTRLVEAGRFADGRWMVVVAGVGRFRVEEWLPDDPYPLAAVEDLPEEDWVPGDADALSRLQATTRRVMDLAREAGEMEDQVDPEWSDDPVSAAWQVCALAPVGAFDRQRLLEAASVAARLELLAEQLAGVEEMFAFRRGDR